MTAHPRFGTFTLSVRLLLVRRYAICCHGQIQFYPKLRFSKGLHLIVSSSEIYFFIPEHRSQFSNREGVNMLRQGNLALMPL